MMTPISARLTSATTPHARVRRRIGQRRHAFVAIVEAVDRDRTARAATPATNSVSANRCVRRPEEVDAPQEAEEQRRVAERRQRAADVRDQEDEEHDDVHVGRRLSLARSSGRIISIEAPVVPMRLASTVPIASSACR